MLLRIFGKEKISAIGYSYLSVSMNMIEIDLVMVPCYENQIQYFGIFWPWLIIGLIRHLYGNLLMTDIKIVTLLFSENHEKECKNLTNQIRDLDRQKEAAMREVGELKVQLKLVEETRDNIRRDLIEANRRIREGKMII